MKLTIYFLLAVFLAVYDVQGNSRIFQGETDTIQNIAVIFTSNNKQFCTGAVISPRWLLTSASCARLTLNPFDHSSSWRPANYYNMKVGMNFGTGGPDFSNAYLIEKSIPHPSFNPITMVNDIGLINVNIADSDNPVILKIQSVSENLIGLNCIVRGYGFKEANSITIEIGMKTIQTMNSKVCSNYGETILNKICTSGDFTCTGDQGAPLIKSDNGVNIIIGVASLNNGTAPCGELYHPYSLFTQVYPYKSWIRTTTGISI